jgi:hypothetical protein
VCWAVKAAATTNRAVTFTPQPDGQASVFLTGPAVPLTRWYSTLDGQARALRQAGDGRTLDALRFDLATSTFPCMVHPPADPTVDTAVDRAAAAAAATAPGTAGTDTAAPAAGGHSAGAGHAAGGTAAPAATVTTGTKGDAAPAVAPAPTVQPVDASAGLRLSGVEPAAIDCRRGQPVQAMIVVPVETALGSSNDPAWLDGYGWLDAPSSRQLLVDAELRRVCAHSGSRQLVDLADRDRRPTPTPDGVRGALLELVGNPITLTDVPWRTGRPTTRPTHCARS